MYGYANKKGVFHMNENYQPNQMDDGHTSKDGQQSPKKQRRKGDFLKLTVYTAVFGMIGGVSFYGVSQLASKPNSKVEIVSENNQESSDTKLIQTSTVTSGAVSVTNTSGEGVSSVADAVLPSIVQIQIKATQTETDMFGRTYEQEGTGSGSGIIIGQDNENVFIATNNHVVEGSNSVTIQFIDDTTVSATVKGTDSNSDLAVVSVKLSDLKSETISKIKVAQLGDSEKLKVGEQAIAIGNALGYGTSVTVGYISALNREVTFEDGSMTLIQTDAAINPGNSGGALVNANGQVIGINSAKFASEEVEGMGFAIPISDAVPIINNLMNSKTIPEDQQAYLGIKGNDISEQYAQIYNMPEGIYIVDVTDGSPAEKAGIQKGYIITGINGTKISNTTELQEQLAKISAGSTGTITVQIGNNGSYEEKELKVTFGSKSQAANQG